MPLARKIETSLSTENLPFIIKTGAAVLGCFLLSIAISRLIYPFDLGQQEAFSWLPASHLLEGKNPYSFALTPPYSMAPYGVFFYSLLAVGIEIFGMNLWWGRLLSAAGFVVSVWAATRIVRKLTNGNPEAAWVTGLVSLALFPGQSWIGILRPDLIALGLVSVALYLT